MDSKMRKKAPPYLYDGPPQSKQEKEEETEDIYDADTREKMLDEDDINSSEAGFMMGREQESGKKATRKNAIGHTDEISVELAKEDAEDS